MFQTLLGPGHAYATYDVQAGQLPQSPDEQDAWIITGSSAGVYDDLPWIAPLLELIAAIGRLISTSSTEPEPIACTGACARNAA